MFDELTKRPFNYIEVDGVPVAEPDLMKWAQWMEKATRHVADETIDGVRISTVFLGVDHGFAGTPLLYETMVFDSNRDSIFMDRYSTRELAQLGHADTVEKVKRGLIKAGDES